MAGGTLVLTILPEGVIHESRSVRSRFHQ
jgi:hypothetical protein